MFSSNLSDLPIEQLVARLAFAQLYLIQSDQDDAFVAAPDILKERSAFLDQLELHGLLFGYGPIEGKPSSELFIVAAASREDAELIAAYDPLRRIGARRNIARAHIVNEGVACFVARAMAAKAGSFASWEAASKLCTTPFTFDTQVQLIWLNPTEMPKPQDDMETPRAHFVWLRENEMAAKLLSCGPVESVDPLAPDVWPGGLAIVATSRSEADAIVAAEPSQRAGYRRHTVRGWRVQRGLAAPIAYSLRALGDTIK